METRNRATIDDLYHVPDHAKAEIVIETPSVPMPLTMWVRSEHDDGPRAEKKLAAKRADYFAAGTLVVWDVDLLSDEVVKVYRATDPDTPTISGPVRTSWPTIARARRASTQLRMTRRYRIPSGRAAPSSRAALRVQP